MCANAFKHSGSVMQCVGQNVDLRIAQLHVLAIKVDNQIRIGSSFHCATSFGSRCQLLVAGVISRFPVKLTPPRQGALIELVPALAFHQAA